MLWRRVLFSHCLFICLFVSRITQNYSTDITKFGGKAAHAHSIVSSRLDYANALLHGTSDRNLGRLQVAQNSLSQGGLSAPPPFCKCH